MSEKEGLIVSEDSPNLVDHNGSLVESSNAVEISSIEQISLWQPPYQKM